MNRIFWSGTVREIYGDQSTWECYCLIYRPSFARQMARLWDRNYSLLGQVLTRRLSAITSGPGRLIALRALGMSAVPYVPTVDKRRPHLALGVGKVMALPRVMAA